METGKPGRYREQVAVGVLRCRRCGGRWVPKVRMPKKCPKCGSPNWRFLPRGRPKKRISSPRF